MDSRWNIINIAKNMLGSFVSIQDLVKRTEAFVRLINEKGYNNNT
jgi:hypothetical protein